MIVCIAEKPSVAKDIARVIGATQSHDGYMEGNGYQVTWTFGHLCTLKEPHDYTPLWKPWALSRLPMIPPRFGIKLIDSPTIAKQFHIIEQLMQKADRIINCGDAGQEGELIQRWVMQKARATCPVSRLWISSLTEESIREGFSSLKDQSEYQSLYEAGLSRAIGDWLLGMNATRLYTLKYGQNRQVLSIGRVQTPTLALIVNRYWEIHNFQPQPYWVLTTVYRDTTFTAVKGKYPSAEQGQADLQRILGQEFTVTDITTKKGKEAPPRLYDLTSLQVECNKRYGFSADQTLQLIQGLYEKKYTTYPRVDTTYLSDDIYPKCPKILQGLTPYATLTAPLLSKKLPKSKKVFDSSKVTDHHAIIPTGVAPQSLSPDEQCVYDEVCRHFIAVFYPDCVFSQTTVMGDVNSVAFKAGGKQILEPGWRTVIKPAKNDGEEKKDDENKNEERILPAFTVGEHGPHQPQLTESNEQALCLTVKNLSQNESKAVYKNQNLNLRQYKRLQMFVHANHLVPNNTQLEDNQLAVFIRLGSDYKNNYYEYLIPLKLTPQGNYRWNVPSDRPLVWPEENMLDIDMSIFTAVKKSRNKARGQGLASYNVVYSEYDPNKPNNKVSIVGNPSLAEVKTMVIGVRNLSSSIKSGEVWVNELRLRESNNEGGWAASGALNVQLSDFGSVNMTGRYITDGFGGLEESILQRSTDTQKSYAVTANLELGKLFPEKAKVFFIDFLGLAREVNNEKGQNVVASGAVIKYFNLFDEQYAIDTLCQFFTEKGKGKLNDLNVAALKKGFEAIQ